MRKINKRNFRIFAASASVSAFAIGLFLPFYFIFIRNFGGGLEQYGTLMGVMMLSYAAMSYFAGRYSDKLGRKPFFLLAGFVFSVIIFSYSLINTLFQLDIVILVNDVSFLNVS